MRSGTGGSTEYLFTGQQRDDTLGYTYLRARYYDPAIGRFISKDPFPSNASKPESINRYVYVSNNPTNLTDPSGQCPWCPLAIGALIGGGIELGVQLIENGGELTAVDWADVGISAGAGAMGAELGVAGGAFIESTLARAAFNAVGSGLIGAETTALNNHLHGRPLGEGVLESFALSGFLGGLGSIIDDTVQYWGGAQRVAQPAGIAVATSGPLDRLDPSCTRDGDC